MRSKMSHSDARVWYKKWFISSWWLSIKMGAVDESCRDVHWHHCFHSLHQYTASQYVYIQFVSTDVTTDAECWGDADRSSAARIKPQQVNSWLSSWHFPIIFYTFCLKTSTNIIVTWQIQKRAICMCCYKVDGSDDNCFIIYTSPQRGGRLRLLAASVHNRTFSLSLCWSEVTDWRIMMNMWGKT